LQDYLVDGNFDLECDMADEEIGEDEESEVQPSLSQTTDP